ncbi:sulfite exporter TauE/SafE family protein [Kineobactrum salinum]|uniref:Sulfite exporter TauE/SafE family protein n=1 Tax=Kineobactrum salinum TaxID=2708301 RepID=A0A6C0U4Y1_9GAMM|nr:sulfite exporter TauE/SafE family protein [Kineobactrum salinum]QIB64504.1 sulfite exporter TauE/SafE family protein [Kineobactrum salinum]
MITELVSAFGLGLAGAGHCLGMCGGIAAALQLGGGQGTGMTLAYHGGRLTSYTVLGAALGLAAGSIDIAAWTIGLRYLAGILLVAMGCYIAGWWHLLQWLERGGAVLWRPVQKWTGSLLPLRHPAQAAVLGMCWGLMPCGLIYSSLAWAATAQDYRLSALMMLFFGLGTLPAMLATSFGAGRVQALLRRRGLKALIGLLLICAGLWSLYTTIAHHSHLGH